MPRFVPQSICAALLGLAVPLMPVSAQSATGAQVSANAAPANAAPANAAPAGATPASAAPASAAATPASIDPSQLAAARITVDRVFPAGTYARMMNGTMGKLVDSMLDGVRNLPLRDFARVGGASEADLARLGPGTLRELTTILDPAFDQRNRLAVKTMFEALGPLMTSFEPEIRDGLTRAYARHFTATQLADLNAFFATPTGAAYARDSMVIFMEPDVMEVMQGVAPKLMAQMPAVVEKIRVATAGLPPPRRYQDLTPAERDRFGVLFGKGGEKGK